VIGAALITTPALAQSAKQTDAGTTQTASAAGVWQGSKLVSMNVYNAQDEKIGTIKDLMVSKNGGIDTVVIGVGGFLGVGERDVAVKFSDMKWSNEPVKTASSGTRPTTTGAASTNAAPTSSMAGARTYPDHAIYNASKDQLKAMPQFDYNK
jgi:sporulation protein YlmC with PRC-barrel domain